MMEKVKRPGKKLNRQGQGRDVLREPRGISGSLNNGKLDERGLFPLENFVIVDSEEELFRFAK